MRAEEEATLGALNQLSTDDLYALVGDAAGILGFDDDDGAPPKQRGQRILSRLRAKLAKVLCKDAGFCRLITESHTKTPLELAAIAADVLLHCDAFIGFPIFALALLVVREFLENLCV